MSDFHVPPGVLVEIARQAEAAFPAECCGLLAGGDLLQVATAAELMNLSPVTGEFRISPDEFHTRGAELLADGHSILGVYHSHPDGTIVPSREDIEGMTFPGVMLIAAYHPEGVAFVAYQVSDGRIARLPIHAPTVAGQTPNQARQQTAGYDSFPYLMGSASFYQTLGPSPITSSHERDGLQRNHDGGEEDDENREPGCEEGGRERG